MASTTSSGSRFLLAGQAEDGWSNENEATATCFCGAVQLVFPLKAPGLVDTFICNCADCHKLTASMFASNFTVLDSHLRHHRGEENLTQYAQSKTVISKGNTMTNFFCKTCGSLMYRRGTGFPGASILRIGTVDDFNLMDTVLKPRIEQFVKDRAAWLSGGEGVEQCAGYFYGSN
ncbi:hypothetical protein H072_6458 [Dactylellina haptotyla CBS 200.50]|uniref:CENP-V/GFA domain-containing protein n=1 Tax=Dactylellina haptotyla (strain CBS 200.50) TaxID=1284197 RepID=S8AA16_DACHA|nr:hypothetical protein H072_6458 [Dactylellina haptotyla CBS 200.50]